MAAVALLGAALAAAGLSQVNGAAQLLQFVRDRVGALPSAAVGGYRLSGSFIYKGSADEIPYHATYTRSNAGWTADFAGTDASCSMRFALTGNAAWAASPELTSDVDARLLPYCAAYDFPFIYSELLNVLERGAGDPVFRAAGDRTAVYVRGKLRNGLQATFLINTVDHFPRKVAIEAAPEPVPAWFFLTRNPDGSRALDRLESSAAFELWFSDPVEGGGYRYPERTDYVGPDGVVGSFFTEKMTVLEGHAPIRPPTLPWAARISFRPSPELHRPSLFVTDRELPEFRERLRQDPWSGWARTNAMIAVWAVTARWISVLFPGAPSLTILGIGVLIVLAGTAFVMKRRRAQFGKPPKYVLPTVSCACIAALLAGTASIQVHNPMLRSLFALHVATRYTISGNKPCAAAAGRLLRGFSTEAPPGSVEELARTCQAYAIAYDLISPALPRARQQEIEQELYASASTLYGALQGWRSNTASAATLSAGLGLAGLAIHNEEFISAARDGLEKFLRQQLVAGLHRDGPGPGATALNHAAGLMFALKRAGRGDFYSRPEFENYVRSTLELLSPVGTLPLFGETSLDHSAHLIPLLYKVATRVPAETGRQCLAAVDAFTAYGRHSAGGMKKVILTSIEPARSFFSDPYVLFLYDRGIPAAALPGASAVLGQGHAAVLRSGTGADALYLALNGSDGGPGQPRRDVLSFDLYAFHTLLLHGAGFPGALHNERAAANQTASANSITFNGASQLPSRCTGVISALVNQPVFDHVRILADRTYEAGQVQRDVVMVRPEGGHAGYFLLIDEVHSYDPDTRIESYLHGRGRLAIGLNQVARWTCPAFSPRVFRGGDVTLTAVPLMQTTAHSGAGRLLFENSSMNQTSASLVLDWTGSNRVCTVLYPRAPGTPEPGIEMLGSGNAGRIGDDFVSFSDPGTRRTVGGITHAGEYAVVRERGESFPAVLLIFGTECRIGMHSVTSTKPVSLSLDGLRGSIVNSRPDTVVEISSPEIQPGARFQFDGVDITTPIGGKLVLALITTGEHRLVASF